jgi:hypothetical protein
VSGPQDSQTIYHDAHKIQVKNVGETDCPAYGILRISGGDDNGRRSYIEVERPDDTYRHTYLVAGPKPIAAGKPGVAYFATHSPVWALWNSSSATPAVGMVFGPRVDAFDLTAHAYGFQVVGDHDSAADPTTEPFRRVLVLQQPPAAIYGTLDADLVYQSTAAVSVRTFEDATTFTDTAMNVTAYDALLSTSKKISSGTYVKLERLAGKWAVTGARLCPVST